MQMNDYSISYVRAHLKALLAAGQAFRICRYDEPLMVCLPATATAPSLDAPLATPVAPTVTRFVPREDSPSIPDVLSVSGDTMCRTCRQITETRLQHEDGDEHRVCLNCLIRVLGKDNARRLWQRLPAQ